MANEQSPHFNLQHEERTVKAYTLTEDEIDSIGALDLIGTIALAFLTTFAGSALTFWFTAEFENPYAQGILAVLIAATLACGVLFGWSLSYSHDRKKRIKRKEHVTKSTAH